MILHNLKKFVQIAKKVKKEIQVHKMEENRIILKFETKKVNYYYEIKRYDDEFISDNLWSDEK